MNTKEILKMQLFMRFAEFLALRVRWSLNRGAYMKSNCMRVLPILIFLLITNTFHHSNCNIKRVINDIQLWNQNLALRVRWSLNRGTYMKSNGMRMFSTPRFQGPIHSENLNCNIKRDISDFWSRKVALLKVVPHQG